MDEEQQGPIGEEPCRLRGDLRERMFWNEEESDHQPQHQQHGDGRRGFEEQDQPDDEPVGGAAFGSLRGDIFAGG